MVGSAQRRREWAKTAEVGHRVWLYKSGHAWGYGSLCEGEVVKLTKTRIYVEGKGAAKWYRRKDGSSVDSGDSFGYGAAADILVPGDPDIDRVREALEKKKVICSFRRMLDELNSACPNNSGSFKIANAAFCGLTQAVEAVRKVRKGE